LYPTHKFDEKIAKNSLICWVQKINNRIFKINLKIIILHKRTKITN